MNIIIGICLGFAVMDIVLRDNPKVIVDIVLIAVALSLFAYQKHQENKELQRFRRHREEVEGRIKKVRDRLDRTELMK